MPSDFVFSSESVTAGHPDKVCDQISDAVVDRYLRQDQAARVTAECAVSTGVLFLSVKAQSGATVDAPAAAREVLREIGYERDGGFDARTCTIMTSFHEGAPQVSPWLTLTIDHISEGARVLCEADALCDKVELSEAPLQD